MQMIREICEAYDIEILEMEIMEEHIHLLVSFPPSRSIGEVVRIIKSNSGRGMFREFPSLKRKLWGGELWEDGYFARTVGDRMTRDVVDKYIKHHRELEQGPAQLALKLRS
jgi:putative transposase